MYWGIYASIMFLLVYLIFTLIISTQTWNLITKYYILMYMIFCRQSFPELNAKKWIFHYAYDLSTCLCIYVSIFPTRNFASIISYQYSKPKIHSRMYNIYLSICLRVGARVSVLFPVLLFYTFKIIEKFLVCWAILNSWTEKRYIIMWWINVDISLS